MANRHAPDNSWSDKREKKSLRNVALRDVLCALRPCEHVQIPRERHPFFVEVEERRRVRRCGPMSAEEFFFFVDTWQTQCQTCCHDGGGEAQLIVQSVSDDTSLTKIRFPETTGCVHVSLPATL